VSPRICRFDGSLTDRIDCRSRPWMWRRRRWSWRRWCGWWRRRRPEIAFPCVERPAARSRAGGRTEPSPEAPLGCPMERQDHCRQVASTRCCGLDGCVEAQHRRGEADEGKEATLGIDRSKGNAATYRRQETASRSDGRPDRAFARSFIGFLNSPCRRALNCGVYSPRLARDLYWIHDRRVPLVALGCHIGWGSSCGSFCSG
jgi:hypothetical protein